MISRLHILHGFEGSVILSYVLERLWKGGTFLEGLRKTMNIIVGLYAGPGTSKLWNRSASICSATCGGKYGRSYENILALIFLSILASFHGL